MVTVKKSLVRKPSAKKVPPVIELRTETCATCVHRFEYPAEGGRKVKPGAAECREAPLQHIIIFDDEGCPEEIWARPPAPNTHWCGRYKPKFTH